MRQGMADMAVIPIHFQVNVYAMQKGLTMVQRMQEGIRSWEVTKAH